MNNFFKKWHLYNLGLWLIIAINLLLLAEYFQNPGNGKIVVVFFWIQSILLGIENVLKMLFSKTGEDVIVNGQQKKSTFSFNLFAAIFFMIHFGIFILVFGVWAVLSDRLPAMGTSNWGLLFPGAILLAAGMIIELPGKLIAVQKKSPGIMTFMFAPYLRLLPFVLIIFSNHFSKELLIPAFLLLKTGVEIIYYYLVDRPVREAMQIAP